MNKITIQQVESICNAINWEYAMKIQSQDEGLKEVDIKKAETRAKAANFLRWVVNGCELDINDKMWQVCMVLGISLDALLSSSRTYDLAYARKIVAMYLMRDGYSAGEIADKLRLTCGYVIQIFNHFDHYCFYDKTFRRKVANVEKIMSVRLAHD